MLIVALATAAVRADVVVGRRVRARQRVDVVAQGVAAALVVVWLWQLWEQLRGGCLDGSCSDEAMWQSLYVMIPVVTLVGLAVAGWCVRRRTRAGA